MSVNKKIGMAKSCLIMASLHTLPKWQRKSVYNALAIPKELLCNEPIKY